MAGHREARRGLVKIACRQISRRLTSARSTRYISPFQSPAIIRLLATRVDCFPAPCVRSLGARARSRVDPFVPRSSIRAARSTSGEHNEMKGEPETTPQCRERPPGPSTATDRKVPRFVGRDEKSYICSNDLSRLLPINHFYK